MKIPEKVVKGFDVDIQSQYNEIKKRRDELQSQLMNFNREIEQVKLNLGFAVLEGFDTDEYISQLGELRLKVEVWELGIEQAGNQMEHMRRVNGWIIV